MCTIKRNGKSELEQKLLAGIMALKQTLLLLFNFQHICCISLAGHLIYTCSYTTFLTLSQNNVL